MKRLVLAALPLIVGGRMLASVLPVSASAPQGARPAEPNAPNPIAYVESSSRKVCQLTGETDHQSHQPTVSRTASRVGLESADLGYSFEHKHKLFCLFGDAAPTRTFDRRPNGRTDPPRSRDADDAIGFTSDTGIDQARSWISSATRSSPTNSLSS